MSNGTNYTTEKQICAQRDDQNIVEALQERLRRQQEAIIKTSAAIQALKENPKVLECLELLRQVNM